MCDMRVNLVQGAIFLKKVELYFSIFAPIIKRSRSLMDKISDSGSEAVGSIPAGITKQILQACISMIYRLIF